MRGSQLADQHAVISPASSALAPLSLSTSTGAVLVLQEDCKATAPESAWLPRWLVYLDPGNAGDTVEISVAGKNGRLLPPGDGSDHAVKQAPGVMPVWRHRR